MRYISGTERFRIVKCCNLKSSCKTTNFAPIILWGMTWARVTGTQVILLSRFTSWFKFSNRWSQLQKGLHQWAEPLHLAWHSLRKPQWFQVWRWPAWLLHLCWQQPNSGLGCKDSWRSKKTSFQVCLHRWQHHRRSLQVWRRLPGGELLWRPLHWTKHGVKHKTEDEAKPRLSDRQPLQREKGEGVWTG